MRKRALLPLALLALALAASPARAHVGSPNVFYDGDAGPYPVRVIVRPPAVVPGLAEITVRVKEGEADGVTVQPVQWRAGTKGAPPPDAAQPVPGDPELWSAQLWFMEQSSYSVRVHVKGPAGEGTAQVPVSVVPARILKMDVGMGAVLLGLGVFLFAGALTLVHAAVRESVLAPGEAPDTGRRTRARVVTALAGLFLALLLWGGKGWWDGIDSRAQEAIFKPFGVETAAGFDGGQRVLTLKIEDERSREWTPLMPDHGKLMHMFLVREPGLDAFAHLHPVPQQKKEELRAALPPLPAGTYRVYADVVHESGFPQTLVDTVTLPAAPAAEGARGTLAPDPDDSWRQASPIAKASGPAESPLEGGGTMLWHREPLAANRETTLRFEVRGADGGPVYLEPYMGMLSHAVVTRDDGKVFVHLHPMGSINMAAQQVFTRTAGAAAAAMDHSAHSRHAGHGAPSVVSFPYEFPEPGRYRLWVQVKSGGRVETGVFDAEVASTEPLPE